MPIETGPAYKKPDWEGRNIPFGFRQRAEIHTGARASKTERSLYQPDFGITPFSTFMGAIKIKPEVRIELHIMQTQLEKVVSSNPDFFPKGLSAVRKMIKDLCLKDPEHRPVDQSKTKRSTKQFIPLKISFSNAARCTSKNDLRTPAA